MHHVKRIALWSLGFLLLSAAGMAVFLATAGDGFYRWAAGRLLEGSVDRTIRVDGTFSFDVGLEPTLVVTDLWVGNAPWAQTAEMARVERAEVQVALMPLFSGIVRLPRLVLEGLTVELEKGPDGEENWKIARASGDDGKPAGQKDLVIPLLEFISLKNVSVTYRDRQSGRDTEILLDSLRLEQTSDDASRSFVGEGSLNQTAFGIEGRLGSIDDALAATVPYPFEVTLDTSGLVAKLSGTAENLPEAQGFDISLTAQAPSIGQILETWNSDLTLEGRAEASARLKGDLDSLSVEDIVLRIVGQSGQELHAEGSLSDLLTGRGLDLRISGKLGPQPFPPLRDLPHELSDFLNGIARLDVAGRITGNLEAPAFEIQDARLEHSSGAEVSLQGHAELDLSGGDTVLTELEATSVVSLPGPALLEQALGTELPDLGAIQASARLSWSENWITLESLKAEAESFAGLRVGAEGRIGKLSGQGLEFDPQLDFSASIEQSQPLVSLISQRTDTAPPAKEAKPSSNGSDDDLVLLVQQGLEALGLHPGPEDGMMGPRTRAAIEAYQANRGLTIDGRATEELLQRIQQETGFESQRAAPEADHIPSRTASFEDGLPELGPIKASGRLLGRDGTYRLDDLRLTIGAKNGFWIEASGALETLRPELEKPLDGLTLKVTFALPSSRVLSSLIPPEVTEVKEIRGQFDIRGSPESFSITKARIEVKGPGGLAGVAVGQVGKLSLAPSFAMAGLSVELEVRSPGNEGVSELVGFRLPDLGPVRAKAALGDRGDLFILSGIDVSVGPADKPVAHASGEIGDLLAMQRIELSGGFNVPASILLGLDTPAENSVLGTLRGQFNLSDADGSLGMETLSIEVIDTKLHSISVKGKLDDIMQRDDLRFQVSLKVPNPEALGREIGFDVDRLGVFSFTGQVSGSDEDFLAEGTARLGQTDLSGTLSGSFTGKRPVLRAKLYSPVFRFADFGLVAEADAPEIAAKKAAKQKEQEKKPEREWLFGEDPIPFEALKDFDLDLDVLLDQLEGVHLDIDKAEVRLDLEDGLLKVDPLRFNFVGGSLVIQLVADARENTPKVSLKVTADDVDLGDLLAQTEVDVPLDGDLDMILDLEAVGISPRALSSSLRGDLDLAVNRGHIRTSLLELTARGLVNWLVSDSARKGYSALNCVIVRFDFHDGVGESKKLILLDTAKVSAPGEGIIDLRNETIDIKINPYAKKKRFIKLTTPFAIEGPLASPSVKFSSTGATARMVGEIVLTPLQVLGGLLRLVRDRGKDAKNPCLVLQDGTEGQ